MLRTHARTHIDYIYSCLIFFFNVCVDFLIYCHYGNFCCTSGLTFFHANLTLLYCGVVSVHHLFETKSHLTGLERRDNGSITAQFRFHRFQFIMKYGKCFIIGTFSDLMSCLREHNFHTTNHCFDWTKNKQSFVVLIFFSSKFHFMKDWV